MFGIGIPEIVIIAIVFGILFFGSKKMIEFSRSLGRLSGEFKKGRTDIERELKESETKAQSDTPTVTTSETPENKS
jgi:sec-independent protein translocase protein TatA